MHIDDIKMIHGPNQWDEKENNIIVLSVDLGSSYELRSDRIDGLGERIKETFSGEYAEIIKEDVELLLQDVKEGIRLPELIGRCAVLIQKMTDMKSRYLRWFPGEKDQAVILFSFQEEEAGSFAAEVAIDAVDSMLDNASFNLEKDLRKLERIRDYWYIGLSTGSVVEELEKRGIPYTREKDDAFILFGYGSKQKRIQATISGHTSFIAVDIAGDKDTTKYLLQEAGVPVPEGIICNDQEELNSAIKTLGFPVVIKPLDGNHGRGISINIRTMGEALEAFDIAQNISNAVIVERFIQGFDYRMLVINYKFVAALKRTRAFVKGDGRSTIEELINMINREPRRQKKPGNILTPIKIDNVTLNILKKQGLDLESVLPKDEIVYVKETANVSTGAVPTDVTDTVHPHNIFHAERIARLIGLDICGVDLISPNISIPFHDNRAAVVEVNAAPGIRMHMEPAEGKPRNVAGMIGELLFPEGDNGLIPIIAVAGTREKSEIVNSLVEILNNEKRITGSCSSDGLKVNNITLKEGKRISNKDERFLLKDPTVDLAVFEIDDTQVYSKGLAFNQSFISIITGIPDKGTVKNEYEKEIDSIAELMSRITCAEGELIINAESEPLKNCAKNCSARVSVYSRNGENDLVRSTIRNGGLAAVIDRDEIKILTAKDSIHVAYLEKGWDKETVPEHILPSVLAAYLLKTDPALIANKLNLEAKAGRGFEKETRKPEDKIPEVKRGLRSRSVSERQDSIRRSAKR